MKFNLIGHRVQGPIIYAWKKSYISELFQGPIRNAEQKDAHLETSDFIYNDCELGTYWNQTASLQSGVTHWPEPTEHNWTEHNILFSLFGDYINGLFG
jgi:hypothetical protein